jgi:propionyl-CoA synthetase
MDATPDAPHPQPGPYAAIHAASLGDPEAFWLDAARAIDWTRPPTRAFDSSAGSYGRWFPDGSLNACHNAVDRHVAAGRGEQAAILYDSPVTGTKRRITYADLRDAAQVRVGDPALRAGDGRIV